MAARRNSSAWHFLFATRYHSERGTPQASYRDGCPSSGWDDFCGAGVSPAHLLHVTPKWESVRPRRPHHKTGGI